MGQDHEWVVAAARRFERPLLAYVRRLLRDVGENRGEDIVQEAFLRLCKQSRTDIEPRLGPWLFTVCRRHVVDILRKENRMTALSETAEPPISQNGPAELVEANDLNRAVLDRLNGFPPNQQEAVRLKFLQQFSYREIAEVMNVSESHVGVLIHTAIKKLRQAFAERPVCS
jgi:RNA polymerase sigma-70 factor (ECF subfamily)